MVSVCAPKTTEVRQMTKADWWIRGLAVVPEMSNMLPALSATRLEAAILPVPVSASFAPDPMKVCPVWVSLPVKVSALFAATSTSPTPDIRIGNGRIAAKVKNQNAAIV